MTSIEWRLIIIIITSALTVLQAACPGRSAVAGPGGFSFPCYGNGSGAVSASDDDGDNTNDYDGDNGNDNDHDDD